MKRIKMPIEKTDYKIIKDKRGYISSRNGVAKSICLDQESALHSIWVLENKNVNHFFVADKQGIVSKVDRGLI